MDTTDDPSMACHQIAEDEAAGEEEEEGQVIGYFELEHSGLQLVEGENTFYLPPEALGEHVLMTEAGKEGQQIIVVVEEGSEEAVVQALSGDAGAMLGDGTTFSMDQLQEAVSGTVSLPENFAEMAAIAASRGQQQLLILSETADEKDEALEDTAIVPGGLSAEGAADTENILLYQEGLGLSQGCDSATNMAHMKTQPVQGDFPAESSDSNEPVKVLENTIVGDKKMQDLGVGFQDVLQMKASEFLAEATLKTHDQLENPIISELNRPPYEPGKDIPDLGNTNNETSSLNSSQKVEGLVSGMRQMHMEPEQGGTLQCQFTTASHLERPQASQARGLACDQPVVCQQPRISTISDSAALRIVAGYVDNEVLKEPLVDIQQSKTLEVASRSHVTLLDSRGREQPDRVESFSETKNAHEMTRNSALVGHLHEVEGSDNSDGMSGGITKCMHASICDKEVNNTADASDAGRVLGELAFAQCSYSDTNELSEQQSEGGGDLQQLSPEPVLHGKMLISYAEHDTVVSSLNRASNENCSFNQHAEDEAGPASDVARSTYSSCVGNLEGNSLGKIGASDLITSKGGQVSIKCPENSAKSVTVASVSKGSLQNLAEASPLLEDAAQVKPSNDYQQELGNQTGMVHDLASLEESSLSQIEPVKADKGEEVLNVTGTKVVEMHPALVQGTTEEEHFQPEPVAMSDSLSANEHKHGESQNESPRSLSPTSSQNIAQHGEKYNYSKRGPNYLEGLSQELVKDAEFSDHELREQDREKMKGNALSTDDSIVLESGTSESKELDSSREFSDLDQTGEKLLAALDLVPCQDTSMPPTNGVPKATPPSVPDDVPANIKVKAKRASSSRGKASCPTKKRWSLRSPTKPRKRVIIPDSDDDDFDVYESYDIPENTQKSKSEEAFDALLSFFKIEQAQKADTKSAASKKKNTKKSSITTAVKSCKVTRVRSLNAINFDGEEQPIPKLARDRKSVV